MTDRPERYGLTATYAKNSTWKKARRHVWWSERQSKCGVLLEAETTDTTIPLCGGCRAAMARLKRARGIRV
ncbi:hypothetical protein [Streptomyces hydrogenans]|uniref:hypothetical protein n=1 Tax=Streptomyces hydrogenans TaxID=1873719 RepID=UPI003D746E30